MIKIATPLQFLILKNVRSGWISGSDIRKKLSIFDSAFYRAIKRMVNQGLVMEKGKYEGGVFIRMYKISDKGTQRLKETMGFYSL